MKEVYDPWQSQPTDHILPINMIFRLRPYENRNDSLYLSVAMTIWTWTWAQLPLFVPVWSLIPMQWVRVKPSDRWIVVYTTTPLLD